MRTWQVGTKTYVDLNNGYAEVYEERPDLFSLSGVDWSVQAHYHQGLLLRAVEGMVKPLFEAQREVV